MAIDSSKNPLAISTAVIAFGSPLSTYFLLSTEKVAANTAAINPIIKPKVKLLGVALKITSMPTITNKPNITSTGRIFFLKNKGSINEVNSEVVAKPLRATDTLLYFIEP